MKLVVLTLLSAGVKIEGIFKFVSNKGKENLIQIVHSGQVTEKTKKKVEELTLMEVY